MQKIRNRFHRPLSLTRLVVGSGIALFLAGMFLLQESGSASNIGAARLSFVWAGWILTAGWVLKRAEDRQWPFTPRSRVRRLLPCVLALVLGAAIWRSYGPLMREPVPVPVPVPVQQTQAFVSLEQDAAPVFFGSRNFLPTPSAFLSLTNTQQRWSFERLAAGRPQGSRVRFSSQAMVAPPALSGKLPSSWDIQP